jgi:hypothetical protein
VGDIGVCSLDAGFANAYSASNPEEDFAEAFAAFVVAVDLPEPVQLRLEFFEYYPELVELRDRALAVGLGPMVTSYFEGAADQRPARPPIEPNRTHALTDTATARSLEYRREEQPADPRER